MEIEITFKNPDSVTYAAEDYARQQLELDSNKEILKQEYDGNEKYFIEDKMEEFKEKLSMWVEYSEYLRVVFNTETLTMQVLKNV